jgi:hypothetical protein
LPRDWSDGEASTRFNGIPSGQKAGLPEHRLMWAILQDAVNIMAAHRRTAAHHPGKLKRQTFGWMMSADRCHVFAFQNICETLGLDADWLRGKVLAQEPVFLHAIRRSLRDEP